MSDKEIIQRKQSIINGLITVVAMLVFAAIIGGISSYYTSDRNEEKIEEINEREKNYIDRTELSNLKDFLKERFNALEKKIDEERK